MQKSFWRRLGAFVGLLFLAGSIWVMHPADALAYDNPELLPKTATPVVDLAKTLTDVQEENLVKELNSFQEETGWKLRVLTQFDRTPGRAVINFWGLDDKSILLVSDARGGNILSFSVGDAVYELLPRTFWIELQTRFGNLYYVRENGEDKAILDTLTTVEGCLRKGGCGVVPGLPREQWILTLITSVIGGVICGFAAQPRREGQVFAWQWALIFSPLWGILFLAFGIGPVVTRTTEWLPLFRNVAGFLMGVIVAYLSPVFGRPSPNAES
ncbi:MAG: TPM domain-containing protein [Calothrix sp. FI2-JRJ7]|jgi:energy-converting hydrogenase Eha subunit A|nr:TPM domain-containing protein [Calothrix sp. FI2-JRJ7]OKH53725.1 methanol dehydrogenase [Calothrix sp. HK-06]